MEFLNLDWDDNASNCPFEGSMDDFGSSVAAFPSSNEFGTSENFMFDPDAPGCFGCVDDFTFDTSCHDTFDDHGWKVNQQCLPDQQTMSGTQLGDGTLNSNPNGESELLGECNNSAERPDKRTRRRFPRHSVQILKAWLRDHASNPYPTDSEIDQLKKDTSLKRSQIRTWLANTRRRNKVDTPKSSSTADTSQPNYSESSTSSTKGMKSYDEMNPFERWRILSPEQESVPKPFITRALGYEPKPCICPSEDISFKEYREPQNDALSYSEITGPSLTTGMTATSGPSEFSFGPAASYISSSRPRPVMGPPTGARKRKVRIAKTASSSKSSDTGQVRKNYQCTFCANAFKTKYDWQRHEKAIHLSPESWVCVPFGPLHKHPNGETSCVFCGARNPSLDHIESHEYSTCADKPIHKRTFYRKDHLRQHLRLFHKTAFNEKIMGSWMRQDLEIRSRCGICDVSMATWAERTEHLAAHFENDQGMEMWKGGYGFEAHVVAMVENRAANMPDGSATAEVSSISRLKSPSMGHLNCYSETGKTTEAAVSTLAQADIDDLVALGLSYDLDH